MVILLIEFSLTGRLKKQNQPKTMAGFALARQVSVHLHEQATSCNTCVIAANNNNDCLRNSYIIGHIIED